MRNMTLATLMTIFVAILVLAVGYAAIGNKTLNVNGNATTNGYQANFIVKITDYELGANCTSATISSDGRTATMTVGGASNSSTFYKKGDTATAIFWIENQSSGQLNAELSATVSNATNSDYFNVSYEFQDRNLSYGSETYIEVKVTLKRTVTATQNTGTFSVTVNAEPKN